MFCANTITTDSKILTKVLLEPHWVHFIRAIVESGNDEKQSSRIWQGTAVQARSKSSAVLFFHTLKLTVFSVSDSNVHDRDLNPVLDKESPTSSGGIYSALALCEILSLPFRQQTNSCNCTRGWEHERKTGTGDSYLDTSFARLNDYSMDLTFDFSNDSSPLIVGLDQQRFSQRLFLKPNFSITLK